MIRWLVAFFTAVYLGLCPCMAAERPIAHIYVDLASIPTLAQAVDVLSRPADEPKLIIWKRISALPTDSQVLKEVNAIMPDASVFGERNYEPFGMFVDEQVAQFYQKYETYQFQVHLNAYQAFRTDGHIFDVLPKEQVQVIHFYEDSLGRSLWDSEDAIKQFQKAERIAPTIFHMAFLDFGRLLLDPSVIKVIDFHKMAEGLSEKQRFQIAQLLRVDLEEVKDFFDERPVAVFVDDPILTPEEADAFLEKLVSKHPEIKTYNWLYKNHPRVRLPGETLDVLKKYADKVTPLPNAIPLETLILVGFTPDYVAGYGSSVFYSFQKDQILGYIYRKNKETYVETLLSVGILEPQQVFDIRTIPEIPMQKDGENRE